LGENRNLAREIARRRVAFVGAFLSLVFGFTITEEISDSVLYIADDAALLLLGIVIIVLFLLYRNKINEMDLKRFNNIAAIIFAIGLIIKIFAIVIEAADPDALGDDIPSVIIFLVFLLNRFL